MHFMEFFDVKKMAREAHVLRLGHRPYRDLRLTTHVALISRALGASSMILAEKQDEGVRSSLNKINKIWGGQFEIKTVEDVREFIKEWGEGGGFSVHLTMYGEKWTDGLIKELRQDQSKLLIVIGSQKVPHEIYELVDRNISIGNQPHSEAAALSIFLYEIFGKDTLYRDLPNARQKVVPSPRGKRIEKLSSE